MAQMKAPEADGAAFRHVLHKLIQGSWGVVQNITGLFVFVILRRGGSVERYRDALVLTRAPNRLVGQGSFSLGLFLFLQPNLHPEAKRGLLAHEYGHSLQSALYGPLYLPCIGLPSLLWAGRYKRRQLRSKGVRYTAHYPERQANALCRAWTGVEPSED